MRPLIDTDRQLATRVPDAITAHNRRQGRLILDYIAGYQAEHGWAPTVREIGDAVGLTSPSSTYRQLVRLHDEGRLVLGGGPRMIRLTSGRIELR